MVYDATTASDSIREMDLQQLHTLLIIQFVFYLFMEPSTHDEYIYYNISDLEDNYNNYLLWYQHDATRPECSDNIYAVSFRRH